MNIVAVTSCPTGIAHSQMAAENLEQTADRLGHDITVEVQGAMGTENELSADAIAAADAVIIAADTSVQRDRFEGKPLVKGTVKDAVNDAEHLIDEAKGAIEDTAAEAERASTESSDTDDSGSGDAASESTGRTSSSAGRTASRGGDRSQGLVARLKKLLS